MTDVIIKGKGTKHISMSNNHSYRCGMCITIYSLSIQVDIYQCSEMLPHRYDNNGITYLTDFLTALCQTALAF